MWRGLNDATSSALAFLHALRVTTMQPYKTNTRMAKPWTTPICNTRPQAGQYCHLRAKQGLYSPYLPWRTSTLVAQPKRKQLCKRRQV